MQQNPPRSPNKIHYESFPLPWMQTVFKEKDENLWLRDEHPHLGHCCGKARTLCSGWGWVSSPGRCSDPPAWLLPQMCLGGCQPPNPGPSGVGRKVFCFVCLPVAHTEASRIYTASIHQRSQKAVMLFPFLLLGLNARPKCHISCSGETLAGCGLFSCLASSQPLLNCSTNIPPN